MVALHPDIGWGADEVQEPCWGPVWFCRPVDPMQAGAHPVGSMQDLIVACQQGHGPVT
jgi:hypothetical protein